MTTSLLAAVALRPQVAHAVEFRLAGGAVEEGDDRFRPVAGIEFVAGSGLQGEILAWGRTFGLVTERSVLFSGSKSIDLLGNKNLAGMFGVSILSESTIISTDGDVAGDSAQSTNVGVVFGVKASLLQWKYLAIGASWESHIFPPGVSALYLVTGRKQLLTVNAGVVL